MAIRYLGKKGNLAPSNTGEWVFLIIIVALSMLLLFVPSKCTRDAAQVKGAEAMYVVDTNRDTLYFLMGQKAGLSVADEMILAEYDPARLSGLESAVDYYLKEKNYAGAKLYLTVQGRNGKLVGSGETTLGRSRKVIPLSVVLPSIDGGVLRLEEKVAYMDNYDPMVSRTGVYS